MGQNKASKMSQKACLAFVAAHSPGARCQEAPLARSEHSLGPRECSEPTTGPDRLGSTPRSLRGCHKLAAERATDGVPSEVMEYET